MVDQKISEEDEEVVEDFVFVDAGILHEDGSESVEQLDHRVEEVFVPLELIRQLGFPQQRQVRIALHLAQEVVVIRMVATEGKCRWECHWNVAQNSHDFVDSHVLVASKVDKVVNAAVQSVVH